ncbi:arginine deiminase-related protein [Wenyingzhuangia sp.]|uniref:arginine deiminase-related protein n=1 Tax=Wenyingzhuangia sp. TaxID=1964193 RepID=UPI00321AE89A
MILLDFRHWAFDQVLGCLPDTQIELLQKDFDMLLKVEEFKILDLIVGKPLSISSLFFKNESQIAISPIENLPGGLIDVVLELEDKAVVDYSGAAREEVYFHGQNSLVSHQLKEIALCGVNAFTDESLFEEYCEDFELTPFCFDLPDNLLTRDIACFVDDILLICWEYIEDKKVKKQLFSILKSNGIKVITVTKNQVSQGILNMSLLNGKLLITQEAFCLFTEKQKQEISKQDIEVVPLPFLERLGLKLRDIILQ